MPLGSVWPGRKGEEPEVSLDQLEAAAEEGREPLIELLREQTEKSASSLAKALDKETDSEWKNRLRAACGGDSDFLDRVLPYHALIRTDPWGEPIIIREGSVFVTAGAERRSTGTYYTPRALTEEVVTHALEPIVYDGPAAGKPRDEWQLKPPADLLSIKVCDPAMGSGAFLVQVIRWMSERVVEAWGEAESNLGTITIDGERVDGETTALTVPEDADERNALARRLIGDRCVYGVDLNPLAVEMAKLSLWLVTLAKGRPFSFLDHALKCGDSLLGVESLDQIRYFHPDPDRGRVIHATLHDPIARIEEAIGQGLELRRELEAFTVREIRDAQLKAELEKRSEQAVEGLQVVADLTIGAALSTAEGGDNALDTSLRALSQPAAEALTQGINGSLSDRARGMLDREKPAMRPDRRPFHWPIEFPEVFAQPRNGFDVFVGNPPFRGGTKISGVLGTDYRQYLASYLAHKATDRADLVSFFFLRCARLIGHSGSIGLIATNTISQGDTREISLEAISNTGFSLVRAWKSRKWPGRSSVQVALVWLYHGVWLGDASLNGLPVSNITTFLEPASRVEGAAQLLTENQEQAFEGSYPYGAGFVLAPDEAARLIKVEQRNGDVVKPYLDGKDVNSRPDSSARRWVIDFGDRSQDAATQYGECWKIVEGRVKPERMSEDADRYPQLVDEWWKFWRRRPSLYAAISGLQRVLVMSIVGKTLLPAFTSSGQVYSNRLVVFAYDDDGHFGLLTSAFHWWWALAHGSTLETRPVYAIRDCFETFPQPTIGEEIRETGRLLDEHRNQLMAERNEGLTKTYNRFHSSDETSADVVTLRALHVQLDYVVASAYGWSDLAFDHDFFETAQGLRYTVGPILRTEMLDRLLELNHERHV